jgi:hypothetical protein
MSEGKTIASTLGGIAVIVAEFALALSGYQNPFLAALLAVFAIILFLPLLNERRRFAWETCKRGWETYGEPYPARTMIALAIIGAVLGAGIFVGGGLAIKRSYRQNPPKTDGRPQPDPQYAELKQKIQKLQDAFTKSPSIDDAAKVPLYQDKLAELSNKKEKTKEEREILAQGKLTLDSLEETRKRYLEEQDIEQQQKEVELRQREIERQKAQQAGEIQDKKFSEPLIPTVDYAIGRLFDMLREISPGEPIISNFPSDRPSIYHSEFLKDGTFIKGHHILRIGSHKAWEFHCNCGGTDVAGYLSKYFGFSIRAGATVMMIRSDAYGSDGVTTRHLDISCVHSDDNPHERKQLYSERCSVSEYQESIQKALRELIQDRYNEEPLQPKS